MPQNGFQFAVPQHHTDRRKVCAVPQVLVAWALNLVRGERGYSPDIAVENWGSPGDEPLYCEIFAFPTRSDPFSLAWSLALNCSVPHMNHLFQIPCWPNDSVVVDQRMWFARPII